MLLKQYHILRMQVNNGLGGKKLKAEVEFIENSINALPEKDYTLMLRVFVSKESLREVANKEFVSHETIRKRLKKIMKSIETVYESLF